MSVPHNMTESQNITEQMPSGPHIEILAPQRNDGPESSGAEVLSQSNEVENNETISNSHRPAHDETPYDTPSYHETPYDTPSYDTPSYDTPSYDKAPTYDETTYYHETPSYDDTPSYDARPTARPSYYETPSYEETSYADTHNDEAPSYEEIIKEINNYKW